MRLLWPQVNHMKRSEVTLDGLMKFRAPKVLVRRLRRLALASRLPYQTFARQVMWEFVEKAEAEIASDGKQTVRRKASRNGNGNGKSA